MKKAIIYLSLGFILLSGSLFAQEDFGPIETGAANFLTIPTDARSAAMGGAGVAMTGSDHAIFQNAATALSDETHRGGVTYNFTPWMRNYDSGGFSLNTIGGFYKVDKKSAILAGFRYYNYPKVVAELPGGSTTQSIHPKELAAEIGYARQLIPDLAVSGTLRFIHSDMGSIGDAKSANAVAFDLGAFYKRNLSLLQDASWAVGLQIANIGSKIKYDETKESLPALARLGGSVDLPFSSIHQLAVTADLGYRLSPSDVRALSVSTGAEYTLLQHLMFRGGYHYGDKNKADTRYATAGLGGKYMGGHVDFAWLFAEKDSPLKNTFWISAGYSF